MKSALKFGFAAILVATMFLPNAKGQQSCNSSCQACMGACQATFNNCQSSCMNGGIGYEHTWNYCLQFCQPQETACTSGCSH